MIRPCPCWRITVEACRQVLKVPVRWTVVTASNSASLMLKIIRSRRIPAMFTTMSSRPNSSSACWTIAPAAS